MFSFKIRKKTTKIELYNNNRTRLSSQENAGFCSKDLYFTTNFVFSRPTC